MAQVNTSHSASGHDKIQADLRVKLESEPPPAPTKARSQPTPQYRIIVSLQRPPALAAKAMGDLSTTGRSQIQQHVETIQNTVLQAPTSGSLTVLHRYQNVFGFSAMADREAIFSLVKEGAVVRIEAMPLLYKMDVESHEQAHVNSVHQSGFTGKGVTIAIIDDGIDASHAAFGGSAAWPHDKILGGYDFADYDDDPRIDCAAQSHGTAVAGVAAGNGGGVLGTAPDAQLVFLKIQSADTCGDEALDGDVLAAIDWVLTNQERYGIDTISMSFGGMAFASACDSMSPFRQAVDAAHDAGLILFAAAGNEAQSDAISHPACLSNIISVGAVYDDSLGDARFNNCTDMHTHADLVTCYSNSAGILNILAPAHCAYTAKAGGGIEVCFGGTSSATPFAAGVAATLLEAADYPLNNDQMRRLLVDSGVAISDPKSDWITPRIDADAALQALRASVGGDIEISRPQGFRR
jgi:subtilisin family serine protease